MSAVDNLSVKCPRANCGAEPGERCINARFPHSERFAAAKAAGQEKAYGGSYGGKFD